jgi:PRC-barrel domain
VTFAPPPAPPPGAKAKVADTPPKPGSLTDVPPTLAQLVDSTVTQKNGAKMGRVVDVLIDAEGVPQALVIDLSDSLAGDKRQVAANWPDLHVQLRNKVITLQMNFTDAQIKAAPTYAPEQPVKIVSPVVAIPESAPAAAGVDTTAVTGAASGAVPGTASGVASAPRPTK